MTYGHRNDPRGLPPLPAGVRRALPDLLAALGPDDLLVLTSDHGCDPTTASTDHSREYALLVAHGPGRAARRASRRLVLRRRRHRGGVARRADATGCPGTPIEL